jgi:hypothetical protein
VGHPGGEQDDGDQSRGDVADALDRQARIGLPAIVPGGNPETCGSRAGRKEKSCADEDDAHGGQSGERVSDVCDKHGFPSTFWHPEKARR